MKPVDNKSTVRVACMIPNGLMLRATGEHPNELTGRPEPISTGPGIRLNGPDARLMGVGATARQDVAPGVTEVDAEFMTAWLRVHENDALVTTRQVWILDEENPTPAA